MLRVVHAPASQSTCVPHHSAPRHPHTPPLCPRHAHFQPQPNMNPAPWFPAPYPPARRAQVQADGGAGAGGQRLAVRHCAAQPPDRRWVRVCWVECSGAPRDGMCVACFTSSVNACRLGHLAALSAGPQQHCPPVPPPHKHTCRRPLHQLRHQHAAAQHQRQPAEHHAQPEGRPAGGDVPHCRYGLEHSEDAAAHGLCMHRLLARCGAFTACQMKLCSRMHHNQQFSAAHGYCCLQRTSCFLHPE